MAFLDLDGLSHLVQWFKGQLGGKVDKVSGKQLSTNDYTTAEKNKLAGLSNYSHPTASGNKHIPAGGAAGKILGWASDGTAQWVDDKNTTYGVFKGATTSADGGNGLVPAPKTANAGQYLKGDGTWGTPTNTTYSDATQSAHGLMTAADKSKLDGIATGANKTVVDGSLSVTSTNPVQNAVVTKGMQFLYKCAISRDAWNEASDKSNWNVIVNVTKPTTAISGIPDLTTDMKLSPPMMERAASIADNKILTGELSMINCGNISINATNKISLVIEKRPVCDVVLYFYGRK